MGGTIFIDGVPESYEGLMAAASHGSASSVERNITSLTAAWKESGQILLEPESGVKVSIDQPNLDRLFEQARTIAARVVARKEFEKPGWKGLLEGPGQQSFKKLIAGDSSDSDRGV